MDDDFYSDEQMTRDMQLLETMQMADDVRAIRRGHGISQRPSLLRYEVPDSERRATSGWRNRGPFFWIMLAIGVYWFFLQPLGL